MLIILLVIHGRDILGREAVKLKTVFLNGKVVFMGI
jgi:hypothetical protein